VFPDNDERCFLITIDGSSTALSGPAIGACPRRAAAEGTRASRRDKRWNSVAWAKQVCDEGNRRQEEPVAAADSIRAASSIAYGAR
jgi:hypothetical protein